MQLGQEPHLLHLGCNSALTLEWSDFMCPFCTFLSNPALATAAPSLQPYPLSHEDSLLWLKGALSVVYNSSWQWIPHERFTKIGACHILPYCEPLIQKKLACECVRLSSYCLLQLGSLLGLTMQSSSVVGQPIMLVGAGLSSHLDGIS